MDRKRTVEPFNRKREQIIRNFGYADTAEARVLIKRQVGPLIKVIEEVRRTPPPDRRVPKNQKSLRSPGENPALLWQSMLGVPDLEMAWAVFSGVLNAYHEVRKDDESAQFHASIVVGRKIWRECRDVYIRRADKAAGRKGDKRVYAKIRKAIRHKSNMWEREAVADEICRKHRIEFEEWDDKRLAHAGNWGYDCILQAHPGLPASPLAISEHLVRAAEAIGSKMMLAHPVYSPSLTLPPRWEAFKDRYGTRFMRHAPDEAAIRMAMASEHNSAPRIQPHMDAVNSLQSVAFTIDKRMLDIVKEIAERERKARNQAWPQFKKAKQKGLSLPKMQKSGWLKKVKRKGGWAVFDDHMEVATELVDRPKYQTALSAAFEKAGVVNNAAQGFYIPRNIDFRGRINPLPHFDYILADHIRALFRFQHRVRIGQDGIYELKNAAAGAYDENKKNARTGEIVKIARTWRANRILWAEDNLDKIIAAASDPKAHLQWIGKAADPFMFIAIARELKDAGVRPDCPNGNPDFITTLPIGHDARCSGAQNYSMLACDPEGARLTNLIPILSCDPVPINTKLITLIPGDPGIVDDLYDNVCQRIQRKAKAASDKVGKKSKAERCAEWWWRSGSLDRSLFKNFIMPYFYGSEEGGQRMGIYDELRDREFTKNQIKEQETKDAVSWLIREVPKALRKMLPNGAPDIMDFLREIARVLSKYEKAAWLTSPTGLPVINMYRKVQTMVPQLHLGNRTPRYVTAFGQVGTCSSAEKCINAKKCIAAKKCIQASEFDAKQCIRSIAPNVIHSLDAAHLVAVVNRCAKEGIELVCVHDSFSVLAPHARRLRQIWREELVNLYENNNVLVQIRENAARTLGSDAELPPVPRMGKLDRKRVLEGRYGIG